MHGCTASKCTDLFDDALGATRSLHGDIVKGP